LYYKKNFAKALYFSKVLKITILSLSNLIAMLLLMFKRQMLERHNNRKVSRIRRKRTKRRSKRMTITNLSKRKLKMLTRSSRTKMLLPRILKKQGKT